jgi:hypothetical protein
VRYRAQSPPAGPNPPRSGRRADGTTAVSGIVASMTSRRPRRTLSDLACSTGDQHIRVAPPGRAPRGQDGGLSGCLTRICTHTNSKYPASNGDFQPTRCVLSTSSRHLTTRGHHGHLDRAAGIAKSGGRGRGGVSRMRSACRAAGSARGHRPPDRWVDGEPRRWPDESRNPYRQPKKARRGRRGP